MTGEDNQSNQSKLSIKRRASAHSAYWMSNALVPIGLFMIYKYGFALESFIGVIFISIGAVGWGIYKQKMAIPFLEHKGDYLEYKPSSMTHGSIKMDASAVFSIRGLGVTVETQGKPDSKLQISRLDFDSNEDWYIFIKYLQQAPEITVLFIQENG